MKFRLEIAFGGEAMQDAEDVAIALRATADKFMLIDFNGSNNILDANGNTVGTWALEEDE